MAAFGGSNSSSGSMTGAERAKEILYGFFLGNIASSAFEKWLSSVVIALSLCEIHEKTFTICCAMCSI